MPTKTTKALTPEQSAIEQNEAAKVALVAAEARAEFLLSAAEQADLDRDAIEDSFKAGDEKTHTALDHAVAGSALIRAEALAAFAASAVVKASAAIISTSTELAEIIAPYVKATHPDYGDVGVSFLRPKEMSDPNRPAATVVQSQPVKRGQGGAMSGAVDIVLLRKSFHVGLEAKKIEDAALKDGISLSISSRGVAQVQGDYVVDNLHVIANSAHAAVPVIDITPSPAMAGQFAHNLAAALCGATRSTTDPAIRMHDGGVFDSAVATVEATNGSIVHIDTDPNGKRFTEAEAKLKWAMARGGRKPQHPIDTYLRRLVSEQTDIFAPGLGVVTDAKIEHLGFPDPLGETEATVRVTFASASR